MLIDIFAYNDWLPSFKRQKVSSLPNGIPRQVEVAETGCYLVISFSSIILFVILCCSRRAICLDIVSIFSTMGTNFSIVIRNRLKPESPIEPPIILLSYSCVIDGIIVNMGNSNFMILCPMLLATRQSTLPPAHYVHPYPPTFCRITCRVGQWLKQCNNSGGS